MKMSNSVLRITRGIGPFIVRGNWGKKEKERLSVRYAGTTPLSYLMLQWTGIPTWIER